MTSYTARNGGHQSSRGNEDSKNTNRPLKQKKLQIRTSNLEDDLLYPATGESSSQVVVERIEADTSMAQ